MANPTGKGGFQDHPELINKEGRPKAQSWQETVRRLSNMTRDELIAYVGAKSKIGKLLKELPADVPMKDALVLITFIQYGRDPNPRALAALMDREEGKPNQPVNMAGDMNVVIRYDDANHNPSPTAPSPDEDPQ